MAKNEFNSIWRVLLVYGLVLLFGVLVIIKVFVLQVVDSKKYDEMAKKVEIRIDTNVMAKRGDIYSKSGTLLAVSVPRYDVYYDYSNVADTTFEKNIGALTDSLAYYFKGHNKAYYAKLLRNAQEKKTNKYVPVIKKLTFAECRRIKGFPIFNQGNVLSVHREMVRDLPYENLAMRTIGYVKERDEIILTKHGLEGFYDSYLRGKKGAQVSRRLNGNIYIPIQSPLNVEPIDGCDIYTSINIELQDIAEESLYNGLVENKAEEGCVVMMDVETGFVEVMANLQYNKATQRYEERDNYAIRGFEEPGSTFKAVVMTALLESNPNFDIHRVLDIGKTKVKTVHGRKVEDSHVINNGLTTVEQGFWESSNIVFAMLVDEAFGNNPDAFLEWIYRTKINEPLRLDIMEVQSNPYIILPKKDGKIANFISMSYGYALQVSPMTLVTYYNAIANNGKMLKPQFVREIRRGDTLKMKFEPIVINESIGSERTIKTLHSLLEGVVSQGTAKKVFEKCALPVAGKTGTAHKAVRNPGDKKSHYDDKHYVATFVGYFPADKPKYSCVVMIANPDPKRHYGVQVAAPIFREIVDRVYASSLGIKADTEEYEVNCNKYKKASMAYFPDVAEYCDMAGLRIVDEEFGTDWVKVGDDVNGGVTIENIDQVTGVVPDTRGMNVMDAVYLLESMGWNVKFEGYGVVESQSVKAGTTLEMGKTIVLKLKV